MKPKDYKPEYDGLRIPYPPTKPDDMSDWWYFDADLSTGDQLVLMYSVNDSRLYPRCPSVRFDLYEPDGASQLLIKEFAYDEAEFATGKCDARYADGQFCRDCGDHYEVMAKIGDYGCHLKFYGEVPPWMAGEDGVSGGNPETGDYQGWVAPQAMSRVEGVLTKAGVDYEVTGGGYHDHNFSTANQGALLDHWHWGKIHTPDLTLDYSVLYPRIPGMPPQCIILAEGPDDFFIEPRDKFHQQGGVTFEMRNEQTEPELGLTFAHGFTINVETDEIKFTLDVDVDRFVMKQRSPELPTGGESAYRYIGNDKLVVERNGEVKEYETHCLHEVVFTHPPVQKIVGAWEKPVLPHADRMNYDPEIQLWEDGCRTGLADGTFEWWYFDGHLDDGSTLAITYNIKPAINPDGPLNPQIMFDYKRADGTYVKKIELFDAAEMTVSDEKCDVRIGKNLFVGDLRNYKIHVEIDDLVADVDLANTSKPWKPGSGTIWFGNKEEFNYAWVVGVPRGDVKATVTEGGRTDTLTGTGYHDHNWGNCSMAKLQHHWYWGRAQVGKYLVVSSLNWSAPQFAYATFPVFFLVEDGEIKSTSGDGIVFRQEGRMIDEHSGKPYHKKISYFYPAADADYTVTYELGEVILSEKHVDTMPPEQAEKMKAIGYDGAYLRFKGTVSVTKRTPDGREETETGEGMWEEMYFGPNLEDEKDEY